MHWHPARHSCVPVGTWRHLTCRRMCQHMLQHSPAVLVWARRLRLLCRHPAHTTGSFIQSFWLQVEAGLDALKGALASGFDQYGKMR